LRACASGGVDLAGSTSAVVEEQVLAFSLGEFAGAMIAQLDRQLSALCNSEMLPPLSVE
jgi:hypothetical protein